MHVDPVSVGLIIDPVSFIEVSINVHEFTLAMGSVIFPATYVLSAIRPLLFALAIPKATDPLSVIPSARLEDILLSGLSFGVGVEDRL